MSGKKLVILHFNVLEKYPPALNFIVDALAQKELHKISVITSLNNSPYKNRSFSGVKIFRLGSTSKNAVLRYISYVNYNLMGTLVLLLKRPNVVLVYETLSIFPAFVYAKIFPKKKIHVHYHEYISLREKEAASRYMKFLYKCEDYLLLKCKCSQTNEDRKELFLNDNTKLEKENVLVFPNTPPNSWWTDFGQNKKSWKEGKIKLVYVGVLDSETMYLEEMLCWVSQHPNELQLTLISQDLSVSATELISQFQSENILLKAALDYTKLPQELVKHDIGLVLYKGHIPNYVFNVPNKVYEYLSCGLKVIVDNKLITTSKLGIENIFMMNLSSIDIGLIKKKLGLEIIREEKSMNSLKLINHI